MIKIRQVRNEDLDACYEIESKCFSKSEAASKENIKKRMHIYPEGFYIAEINGNIVGMINSSIINKDDLSDEKIKSMCEHVNNGENLVIISLLVNPEYQRKGISRRLIQKVIDEAKHQNKKNILLLCKDHLIDFYKKYGFKHKCISASNHGGAQWNEMILKLAN